jgi:hypothetical protein
MGDLKLIRRNSSFFVPAASIQTERSILLLAAFYMGMYAVVESKRSSILTATSHFFCI